MDTEVSRMDFFRNIARKTALHALCLALFAPFGLGQSPVSSSITSAWENSLGMKFKPIPGSHIRMAIWETRVRDFSAFVDATGHDASERFFYYAGTSWHMDTNYWKNPGFPQTGEHPVTGVNWLDAVAFCEWLTMIERSKGVISDHEAYRLPTEEEWEAAVRGTADPAGRNNVANLHPVLNGDPFAVTSPVGSFPANPLGFYDMVGNVWEFCIDQINERQPYRIIRGGSWQNWHDRYVGAQARGQCGMEVRIALYGFRVVLADDDATTKAMREGAGLINSAK